MYFNITKTRCLKHGLLNPNAILTKDEENEYSLYNKTREAALGLCHKQCELFKFDLRSASSEEVTKAYNVVIILDYSCNLFFLFRKKQ